MSYHPEHVVSFQNAQRHTIAIVSRDEHGDVALGSGVLVEIAGRLFVAAAFHCIEDSPVILTEGMVLPKNGDLPTTRIPILASGGDKTIDVGFLEVETGHSIVTAVEHTPCGLEQLYVGPVKPDSIIHVCGWPVYSAESLGPDDIACTLEGFIARSIDHDQTYLYYKFGPRAGKWNENNQWITKATPSPHGFSGGGCWGITKAKDDELYTPIKTTKLLAVQSRWDEVKRVCVAPLIGEWVKLLLARFPDLKTAIASVLTSN